MRQLPRTRLLSAWPPVGLGTLDRPSADPARTHAHLPRRRCAMIKTTLTAVALALTVVSTAHAKDKKPQLPTLALGAWCESTGYHRPEDARLFERGKCIEKLVLG